MVWWEVCDGWGSVDAADDLSNKTDAHRRSERWATNTMPGNWSRTYNFPGIVTPLPLLQLSHCFFSFYLLPHTHTQTHQPAFRFDQRSVLSVHLVVEPAGVAQVVPGAVAPPQRCGRGPAVDALTALWWGREHTGTFRKRKVFILCLWKSSGSSSKLFSLTDKTFCTECWQLFHRKNHKNS